eukprot:24351-Pelagomonas_calceolata.AAC.5
MQTEPESSTLPQEKPTNNANVVSGEPLPLVPKHEAFPKPSLKDPLQHLWHLGLDDDRCLRDLVSSSAQGKLALNSCIPGIDLWTDPACARRSEHVGND